MNLTGIQPLGLGYDPAASVYRLETPDQPYFLKVRSEPINPVSLSVPHRLKRSGVEDVVAPLEGRAGRLSSPLDGYEAALYPFVTGESAMRVGLTRGQWPLFGQTLRQVHSPRIARQVAGLVPSETFDLRSLEKVLWVEGELGKHGLHHPAQQKLAEVWAEQRDLIRHIGGRARRLGRHLSGQSLEFVLCHSDIHAANLLVSGERVYLVDWDTPLLAPPERDLLFVVGSVIARRVKPEEEAWFFEGYGRTEVNPEALAYFRYERAIQDIGEFGQSILFDAGRGDDALLEEARIFADLFAPGDIVRAAMAMDPAA